MNSGCACTLQVKHTRPRCSSPHSAGPLYSDILLDTVAWLASYTAAVQRLQTLLKIGIQGESASHSLPLTTQTPCPGGTGASLEMSKYLRPVDPTFHLLQTVAPSTSCTHFGNWELKTKSEDRLSRGLCPDKAKGPGSFPSRDS